jgi:hypothetical protein
MLFKLLSSLLYFYKKLTTYPDYHIISKVLEYEIDPDIKYKTEDEFWKHESKDWEDGILTEYYTDVTDKDIIHTCIPQNVKYIILRVKYYFNGKMYTAVSNDINFMPGVNEDTGMHFSIPLSSAWLVDHDDKPIRDITEKVKRYTGPRCDFHTQKVPIDQFLYYERSYLKEYLPKIIIKNSFGMSKTISTLDNFTTDLRIP